MKGASKEENDGERGTRGRAPDPSSRQRFSLLSSPNCPYLLCFSSIVYKKQKICQATSYWADFEPQTHSAL